MKKKTKTPRTKIHELIGKITQKTLRKVYNKKSDYYNQSLYYLNVEIENNPQINKILVFTSSPAWKEVDQGDLEGKRFFFYCNTRVSHYTTFYNLHDLIEIKESETVSKEAFGKADQEVRKEAFAETNRKKEPIWDHEKN